MDPDQDKIDFLNLIESSFRLLEIERRQVFQPPTSQKTLLNQIAVVKVLAILEIEEQSLLEVG